jgi:serine/threonine protein kinase/class 3 adenylate cyclase/tetratricopeptide (TPR) repeat protein
MSAETEKWRRVEELYDAALDLAVDERAAFLDQACAGDEELRREVESLLAWHERAGDFIVAPALEVAARVITEDQSLPQSAAGQKVGHYRILSLLGAGGMGEVYLARDTKLGRPAAIKLLPARFVADAERVRRFRQEARAASALNHPNIVTIYEIGETGSTHFIATEFIDGATLRLRLADAPMPLRQVLDVTAQIASALASAHQAGIVHRDIKPENVMLRPDGYVKVLDFGVAKLIEPLASAIDTEASTAPRSVTDPGAIMGTPRYMSPEQARGLKVDARSDIFSLGVVLYEMVAGRAPFQGPTISDVIAAILHLDPPPLARYSQEASDELERIVVRSQVKEREERYQTIEALALDLKSLMRDLEFGPQAARAGRIDEQETISINSRGASRVVCLNCLAGNPGAARFCLNCGASLVNRCSNCQTDLPSGARFCLSCGQQVGGVTAADDARHSRLAAAAPPSLAHKMRAEAQPTGERKVVTALFAELSGSAPGGEEIDAEDWAVVINRAFDRLSQAIYRYEGTIACLIGNSLLAFFGAPVAHEDDPSRAVRAAIDLLAAAREYAEDVRREHGIEFEARVGLNTGPVIVGAVGSDLKYDYTVLGDTVNLAARVQSTAAPMTALITESVYRFVAPVFDCADFGPIEVKGRAEPARVYEARGVKAEPGRVRGVAGLESPMVGRDAELAALLQLSAAVRAGLGRAAVIIGEPGLGKTRLIAEWKKAAGAISPTNESFLQWAEGHCLSYGQGHAYHLLRDLLRSLIGVAATANESTVRAALLTLAEELFGDSALDVYAYLGHLLSLQLEGAALERVWGLDPQALQTQYLQALRQLLQAFSSRRPLALILEDIHWADPSSTELLNRLLPLASTAPILFGFVTRPDRDAPGWKLVSSARDLMGGRLTELNLSELSVADSERLISNLLDFESAPEQIRELIFKKSEGNPFFVEEVIRMLIDRGAIIRSGEKWSAGAEIATVKIPDNLHGLLLARIDRLPNEVRHTLRVASVIGRQFSVKVLGQVFTSLPSAGAIIGQLNTLESCGLIQLGAAEPELEYLFRHALAQDAAYNSLLKSDRKHLHSAAGKALEFLFPERLEEMSATLAYHFERAEIHDKAMDYFSRAGDRAQAAYANQEAIAFYQSAISQIDQLQRETSEETEAWDEAKSLTYEKLANLFELIGQHEEARNCYQHALTKAVSDDGVWRSRLYRKTGNTWMIQRQHDEAFKSWEEAEIALGDAPADPSLHWRREWIQVQLDRLWLRYLRNEVGEMAILIEKTRLALEQYGTPPHRSKFFQALGLTALRRDRFITSEESLAHFQVMVAAARESDNLSSLAFAQFQLGFGYLWRGDFDEAREQLLAALGLAERIGDVTVQSRCLAYLIVLYRKCGQIDEARHYISRTMAVAEAGQMLEYIATAKANLAWVSWREGDLAESERQGKAALELWRKLPPNLSPFRWTALWPLIRVALAQNRILEAIECAQALLAPGQQRLPDAVTEALERVVRMGEQNQLDAARHEIEQAIRSALEAGYL